MIRIVADNKIPFLKGVLESYANVTWLPGKQITRDAAMQADALLVRTRTRCNADLLEGTAVKFIGSYQVSIILIRLLCKKNINGQILAEFIVSSAVYCGSPA
jgi:erythronate-4-phosphate dehydrogenase